MTGQRHWGDSRPCSHTRFGPQKFALPHRSALWVDEQTGLRLATTIGRRSEANPLRGSSARFHSSSSSKGSNMTEKTASVHWEGRGKSGMGQV